MKFKKANSKLEHFDPILPSFEGNETFKLALFSCAMTNDLIEEKNKSLDLSLDYSLIYSH
ncbi:hypothetical protein I79_013380 [Cricetulus griseus]|uniref:Uncharacterized protein n=1 Tax=Cricetulus griseus TaxID=10029 RepID=G3HRB5_CRIGR|nr:hypothetical protein I79_013380 [Cricetulus griseus]